MYKSKSSNISGNLYLVTTGFVISDCCVILDVWINIGVKIGASKKNLYFHVTQSFVTLMGAVELYVSRILTLLPCQTAFYKVPLEL